MSDSHTTNNIIKPGQGYLDLPVSKFVLWTLPFWKSLNCTPNTLTTLGLIFSILCIYFLYKRNVILSIIFLLLRLYFDYADGLYARKYNQTSDFGNFYDSFVDIFFSLSGLFIIFILKTSKKNEHLKYWYIGVIIFFYFMYLVQMSCAKSSDNGIKHYIQTFFHNICNNSTKPILNLFDNITLYIVTIIVIVLFCKYK